MTLLSVSCAKQVAFIQELHKSFPQTGLRCTPTQHQQQLHIGLHKLVNELSVLRELSYSYFYNYCISINYSISYNLYWFWYTLCHNGRWSFPFFVHALLLQYNNTICLRKYSRTCVCNNVSTHLHRLILRTPMFESQPKIY